MKLARLAFRSFLPLLIPIPSAALAAPPAVARPITCEYEQRGAAWSYSGGVGWIDPEWREASEAEEEFFNTGPTPGFCARFSRAGKDDAGAPIARFRFRYGSTRVPPPQLQDFCALAGGVPILPPTEETLRQGEWVAFVKPPTRPAVTIQRIVVYYPLSGEGANEGDARIRRCEEIGRALRPPGTGEPGAPRERGSFAQPSRGP